MYVGYKKIVNILCDWLQAINSSFIIEGEIGFDCDGKIGIGSIKGEFEASKTIGKGIEKGKSYDYAATSGGIVFGSDILGKVGFGADIKHKAIEIATLLQYRGKMKFGTTKARKKI